MRYWSHKMERQAREEGEDAVFIRVLVDGVTPEVMKFMRLAQGLKL